MNRRSFIGGFFAAAVAATILPELLPAATAPAVPLNFAIHEEIGFGLINVDAVAAMFATIQSHDLTPHYMFMHPLDYKKLNPEGYAELVRQQEVDNGVLG